MNVIQYIAFRDELEKIAGLPRPVMDFLRKNYLKGRKPVDAGSFYSATHTKSKIPQYNTVFNRLARRVKMPPAELHHRIEAWLSGQKASYYTARFRETTPSTWGRSRLFSWSTPARESKRLGQSARKAGRTPPISDAQRRLKKPKKWSP